MSKTDYVPTPSLTNTEFWANYFVYFTEKSHIIKAILFAINFVLIINHNTHLGREIGIQVPISRISYYKWMGQIFVLHRLVKENYFSLFTLTDFTLIYYILGFFLVLWKPLLVCFCVVVWVLFSVFWIFCIKPFGYCTRAQH